MSKLNNINISGPFNIVRVEGSLNEEKKVLYLFFDYHSRDTKCNDYGSIDIVQLFNKFTTEAVSLKNEWDLFIEDDINLKDNKRLIERSNYSGIYLNDLRNFFGNKFTERVNNVVKKRNNIRYHYFDLRMKLKFFDIDYFLNDVLDYNYTKNTFQSKLENIYNLILFDYDYFFKKKNKIKDKYNSNNLKKKILNIFSKYEYEFKILLKDFQDILKDVKNSSDIFLKRLTKVGSYDYYYEVRNKIIVFQSNYSKLNANIVDIYFLRRFLDKKYIKNGVIYSGGHHCINLIYILVNLFNFKITNVSYSKVKLDNLNNFVKNSKVYLDLMSQLYPEYLVQCSSMIGFPDMFL